MTKALYAFSGDPITYGHIDIINRAAAVFDHVIVGIGINPSKNYLFSLDERTIMAQQSLRHLRNIEVRSFSGLLVDFAYENGVSVIVKGVRNPDDFNYENILHQVGESQKLGIDTHILFAKPTLSHISSGAVKEIQRNQGSIDEYVPLVVKQRLEEKMCGQFIVGVTGDIGSGKSHVSNLLKSLGTDIPVHNIELDSIAHQILGELKEPVYQKIRQEIADIFGACMMDPDGFINRKLLGEIVFADIEKLKVLNKLLMTPITVRFRRELSNKKGIILLNAALLAETDMVHLCNNHVVLINADEKTQQKRLQQRGLSEQQIGTRIACQYRYADKHSRLWEIIQRDGFGKVWILDNSQNAETKDVKKLLNELKDYFGLL